MTGCRHTTPVLLACVWFAVSAGCPDASQYVHAPELKCPDAPVIHQGEATFYLGANGSGACVFDSTPGDLMVAAMNAVDYAASMACGACVRVRGPVGEITVRIVDLCPECPVGHIDVSPEAFARLADTSLGRIPVTWEVVPCSVDGPILYHFKDGSNPWWTAVQVRNHRYPVFSLEFGTDGEYRSVNRLGYNYFVEQTGMGPGPFTFRVTDIYGHVLVDTGIVHVENGDVEGRSQFLPCGQ